MATYVILVNFTDQGLKNIKGTVDRARAGRALNEKLGIKTHGMYWTQGQYDLVVIVEGSDEAAMTAAGLNLVAGGNVRTMTLRALTESEVEAALKKM